MSYLTKVLLICMVQLVYTDTEKERKILNGHAVDYSKFPHMVSLTIRSYVCGGSLISYEHVVTAAHCFPQGVNPEDVTAQVGSKERGVGGDFIPVIEIDVNPHYNPISFNNDVAVVKLARPVNNSNVIPVEISDEASEDINASVYVAGWGRTENGYPDLLQAIKLVYASHDECQKYYSQIKMNITDNMVCATYPNGNGDSCEGDSGGPLMSNDKLVGLVSFGATCPSDGKFPGVYTRLSQMKPFINFVTGLE